MHCLDPYRIQSAFILLVWVAKNRCLTRWRFGSLPYVEQTYVRLTFVDSHIVCSHVLYSFCRLKSVQFADVTRQIFKSCLKFSLKDFQSFLAHNALFCPKVCIQKWHTMLDFYFPKILILAITSKWDPHWAQCILYFNNLQVVKEYASWNLRN